MKGSKLTEILRGLNGSEVRKLNDFVNSPFYNKNKKISKLFGFLKENLENLSKGKLSRELLWDIVFPGEKYQEQKFRNFISDFIKVIEKFFIVQEEEKNKGYRDMLLLRAMNLRGVHRNFRRVLKDIEKSTEYLVRDEDYYYNRIFIENESLIYKQERGDLIKNMDYRGIIENIDLFFVITKLDMLHVKTHFGQDSEQSNTDFWLYQEILTFIDSRKSIISKEHPIIYSKYLILMTIIKPDEEKYFKQLKSYTLKNWGTLNETILEYVLGALKNYSVARYNKGDVKYKYERYKIYKFTEDNNLITKSGFVSHIEFLNAIAAGLAVSEFIWAKKYFKKYNPKLFPEIKDDASNLALSNIHFHQKEYDKAIDSLHKVNHRKQFFYLRSKSVLAKIYYEKNEEDPLFYLIDAVKHYLVRNKEKLHIIEYEMFSNFFKLLGKLYNDKKSNRSEYLRDLKEEALYTNNLSNKEWLLEKIDRADGRKL